MVDRIGPIEHTPPALWEGISVAALLNIFLRRWKRFVTLPLVFAVLAIAATILRRQYTALTTFIADTDDQQTGQLLGLAAQFGIQLPLGGSQSVQFYSALLHSRRILEDAAKATYTFLDADSVQQSDTYIKLRKIEEDTPLKTLQSAVSDIDDHLDVSMNTESGLITVELTTPWAGLSEGVMRRMLNQINTFNIDIRTSRSHEERRFIEERVAAATREFDSTAATLRSFLEENRDRSAPRLQLEEDRLRRDMALKQGTLTSLAQAYQEARIAEVRNTPVITVVDVPEGSSVATPKFVIMAALGIIAGGIIALAWVLIEEFLGQQERADPMAIGELRRRVAGLMFWRRDARDAA